jgi:hypothetical protein
MSSIDLGPNPVGNPPSPEQQEQIRSAIGLPSFTTGWRSGKTIYVDKDSPSATDTRGSISKYSYIYPFASITAATAAAESGDTIKVLAGDFVAGGTINTKAGVFYDIGPSVSGVRVNSLSGNRTIQGNAAPINIDSTATLTLINAVISSTLSVQLADSAILNLINCQITNDLENGTILTILNGWSGSLLLKDCTLTALNAGATDGATIGIDVQGTTTGAIRLEGNTIIRTAQTGAGDSHSIASTAAKNVTNVGTLFNTHAPDANVTVLIGDVVTNTTI